MDYINRMRRGKKARPDLAEEEHRLGAELEGLPLISELFAAPEDFTAAEAKRYNARRRRVVADHDRVIRELERSGA